ncbi:MAG: hypothetical protein IJM69_10260 [Firmicutes bacterium]|nr:hypothetical protein [Bacillota bacterium]
MTERRVPAAIIRPVILLLILVLLPFLLCPATASAEEAASVAEIDFSTYELYTENMSIDLPDGWYFNTRSAIDPDFLDVSENSAIRLKQYLTKRHVEYNLVAKDLKSEINIIVLHDSKTKLIHDYNTADPAKLQNQIDSIIAAGVQEEKAGDTTYTDGEVRAIGQGLFTILRGEMTEEKSTSSLLQYSTIINGYGINLSIKSYDPAVASRDAELIERIANSFHCQEIYEGNRTRQEIIEFLPPVLMLLVFIGFTIYIFIRQIRKNRATKK